MKLSSRQITDTFEQQWHQLFTRAAVPVVVQHPAWVRPMRDKLAGSDDKDHQTVFIASGEMAGSGELNSLTVLKQQGVREGAVFSVAATWDCGFLFSGTPLLASADVTGALLALLKSAGTRAGAVLLKKIPLQGPVADALQELVAAGKVQCEYFDSHDRAVLKCGEPFEQWYAKSFSTKRRKEYRRLRNRLNDLGEVREETWQPDANLEPWIENFLQLEAAGWKGRYGTAVASDNRQAAFLRESLAGLAEEGKLLFWRITLDDQPIAMLFAFTAGDKVLFGKMAYSEELSRFSPGVMVIFTASKDLLDDGKTTFVDSAADANHPMIDNIWRDRIGVGDVLISIPDAGSFDFSIRVVQERLRRAVRNSVKRAYHRLKRKK